MHSKWRYLTERELKPKFLQQYVRYTKENRGNQTNTESEEPQHEREGKKIQDLIAEYHMPANTHQGLHDFVGSLGCIDEKFDPRVMQEVFGFLLILLILPVQISPFWSFPQSIKIQKFCPTGIGMGTDEWHTNFDLTRRHLDNRRVEEQIPRGHGEDLIQANRTCLQDKDGEFNKYPKKFDNLFEHDNKFERNSLKVPPTKIKVSAEKLRKY
ncbi:hypothetical protein AYI68_g4857 [Smittium mucronatum]|uniref:Uncharacterized protein n=1 Tax=Smittium mucronatum TaxID=133383 RepID=A0A1R0GVV8_9FUNG|nr:hypothetical protein AYI68_g4857 [Smittium mucronatum]